MYRRKSIAIVIPAYNESQQITKVITTLPTFVDKIIVVNDKSKDNTLKIVNNLAKKNKKIILINHIINQGVGGAIASGYKWCRDHAIDIAVVMAGDGQMLPKDLPSIINPIATNHADYSKANRLLSGKAYRKIPKIRYFGNATLSFFTKIASGYWHIMDSQTGYTAINKKMLNLINWDSMYKRYGQPNDLLVRLNVFNAKVVDVPLEPVYGVGEKSGVKVTQVFFTIPAMLVKMFLWRLKEKYIIRDFHPLVFFYFFGFLLGFAAFILLIREAFAWPHIMQFNFLTMMFCAIASVQFISFAMWFDMEYNKELK